jgi:hypothetical protein
MQTPYECDTCTEEFNPKTVGLVGARKKCEAIGEYICDPVTDEIRDYDNARHLVYNQFPIVPFFDGADATLRFFRKMKEQSPTHGACISQIGTYTFGEGLKVVKKKRAGFVLGTEDVSVDDTNAEKFIEFVESMNADMDGEALLTQMWQAHENLKTYGNYFLRVDMVDVAGLRYAFFKVLDCETVRYKLTKKGEKKVLIVSPLWTLEYLTRESPEYLPVYPNIERSGRGTYTTVIHVRNNVVSREWYGMPDSFSSLRYQLLEAQQGQYSTENYANDFIPRTIIEIESDNEDDGNDGFDKAVQQTYTNRAKERKRVVIRRRLPDEKPMNVHEMKANADHEYHVKMSDEAERQIVKSHQFHKVLLGSPTPGKLGQSQEFQQIYRQVTFTTIRSYRNDLLPGWRQAIEIADQFINGSATVTATMSISFKDLFEDYLQAATTTQQNGANG